MTTTEPLLAPPYDVASRAQRLTQMSAQTGLILAVSFVLNALVYWQLGVPMLVWLNAAILLAIGMALGAGRLARAGRPTAGGYLMLAATNFILLVAVGVFEHQGLLFSLSAYALSVFLGLQTLPPAAIRRVVAFSLGVSVLAAGVDTLAPATQMSLEDWWWWWLIPGGTLLSIGARLWTARGMFASAPLTVKLLLTLVSTGVLPVGLIGYFSLIFLSQANAALTDPAAQALILAQERVILWGTVLLMGVISGAAFVIADWLAAPLRNLTAAVQRNAASASPQTGDGPHDELMVLGAAFESMTARLTSEKSDLETRVAERTRSLTAAIEVSHFIATLRETPVLVQAVVSEIQAAFGYYHVQVYLLDEARQVLQLAGGTGEAGQALMRRGHALPFGKGLVGQAAATGQTVLVPETAADPRWMSNPLLPDTKSEAAVPIMAGEKVLGVLDVQASAVNGLEEAVAPLLTAIANQLAVALEHARAWAEMRQTEAMLRLNEARYRIISDMTSDAVFSLRLDPGLDPDSGLPQRTMEWVTEAFQHLTGYAHSELVPRGGINAIVHPDDRLVVQERFRRMLTGEEVVNDYRIITRAGELRWVRAYGRPVFEAGSDRPTHIYGAWQDITERRLVEDALRESEERLRLALDASQIGIWSWEPQSGALIWSDELRALFGFEAGQVVTFDLYMRHVHPDDRATLIGLIEAVLKNECDQYMVEHRIIRPGGAEYWVEGRARAYRDAAGQPIRMAGTAVDITTRKAAEHALRLLNSELEHRVEARTAELAAERNLLRTLIDNLPDDVYVKDRDSRFLIANPASAAMVGLTAEALIGLTDADFFPPDVAARTRADEVRVLTTGQSLLNQEEVYHGAEGRERWVLTTKVPIRDEQQNIVGLVGIGRDITERRAVVVQLQESQALLSTVINATPDWIFVKDRDHRYRLVNQSYADSMNLTPEAMLGRDDLEIGFDEDIVRGNPALGIRGFWADDDAVLTTGQSTVASREPAFFGGAAHYLHTVKVPLRDAAGTVWGVLGFVHDVTLQERAAAALAQRAAEQAALYRFNELLNAQQSLAEVTTQAGPELVAFFDGSHGFLALYDMATRELEYPFLQANGQIVRLEPAILETGPTLHVIRTGQPLVVNRDFDKAMAEFGARYVGDPPWPRSWMCVPMRVAETVVGAVMVAALVEDRFGEDEVRQLQTLSASLGAAIQRARLFAETQARAADLELLYDLSQTLNAQQDLRTLIQLAGDRIAQISQALDAFIGLYEPATQKISFPYVRDPDGRVWEGPSVSLGEGLASRVILSGEPLVFNNITEDHLVALGGRLVFGSPTMRSWLGVPMRAEAEVIGVVHVGSTVAQRFQDRDVRVLSTIASILGSAVQRARLAAEARARAADLALLFDLGQLLNSQHDLPAMVRLVGDRVSEVFDALDATISILEPQTGLIVTPYLRDPDGRVSETPAPAMNLGEGLTSVIMRTGQPLLINRADPETLIALGGQPTHAAEDRVKAWLGVPMVAGDQAIGMMHIGAGEPDRFTERDVRLLSTIAASLAVAVQRVRLSAEARARASEQELLFEIGRTLNTHPDLGQSLRMMVAQIMRAFQGLNAFVALLNPETQMFEIQYSVDSAGPVLDAPAFPVGTGPASHILRTGQPLLINHDLQARLAAMGARSLSAAYSAMGARQRSWLGVPIFAESEVIGVVHVGAEAEGRFSEREVRLLSTVAANISVAVQRARLINQLQTRTTELVAVNRIVTQAAGSLEQTTILQTAAREIAELTRARSCGVALLTEDGLGLRVVADQAVAGQPSAVGLVIPLAGNPSSQTVITTRQSMVIDEAQTDPRTAPLHDVMRQRQTHSLAIIPLLARGEVIGTIAIDSDDTRRRFTHREVTLVETIAAQLANVVDNARLFSRLEANLALLRTVIDSTPDFIFIRDRQYRYRLVNMSYATSWNRQPEALVGRTDRELGLLPASMADAYIDAFLAQDDAVMASGLPLEVPVNRVEVDGRVSYESTLKVPLRQAGGEAWGVLVFIRDYTERELAQASLARRAQELEALNTIGQVLVSAQNLQPALKAMGDVMCRIMNVDTGFIGLLEEAHQQVAFPYCVEQGRYLEPPVVAVGRGLISRIIDTRAPLVCHSHAQQLSAGRLTWRGHDEAPLESWLGVPVFAGDRVAGILSVQASPPDRFGADDVRLLSTIAASVGAALERAHLVEELRTRAAELQVVNGRLSLLVDERTRQNTQLEAANRELEAFSYSVSHDLRSPLRSLDGFSLALLEDYGGQLDATAQGYLHRIRAGSQHMGVLIDGLLRLARISRIGINHEPVPLSAIAERQVALLREQNPGREVLCEIEPEMWVMGDRSLLELVFQNLLHNAWKFTGARSAAHIVVGQRLEEREVVYFVRDNGAGFDMNYAHKLFGAFQRLHRVDEYEGTGIGLATVQRIVARHGGRIWAEGAVGQGATFYFTLRPASGA